MHPSFYDARDVNEVAGIALDRALEIMGTEKGNVQLIRWDNGAALHIVAQQGFGEEFLTVFREVTLQHPSVCGRALLWRRTIVVEDVMADPDFTPYRGVAERAGFRGVQSTPLLSSAGSLVGVVSTHADQPSRPSDEQLAALASLARQAADAIVAIRTNRNPADAGLSAHRSEADWLKAHGVHVPDLELR